MPRVAERGTPRQSAPPTALVRSVTGIPEVFSPYIQPFGLDRTQLDLIKRVCCPAGTTDDQMALYFHFCRARGVHPMDRAIVMTLFKDKDSPDGSKKPVFISTIDYFRSQAEASDALAGIDEPEYGPTVQGAGDIRSPQWARVAVYRVVKGRRRRFVGKALWQEFFPGGGGDRSALWRTKPHHMLAKCAEAQALRKAFPRKLQKLYLREELPVEQLQDAGDTPVTPDEPPKKRKKRGKAAADPVVDATLVDPLAAERYTVTHITEGFGTRSKKPIWKVDLENGLREARVVYTRDPAFHAAFRQLQESRRVFELTVRRDGDVDQVETIDPV